MTSTWTLRMSNIKKFLFALQLRLHVRKMPVLKMMLQLLQSYDRYCLFEHSPNFSLCFLRKQLLFIPDNKHIHSRMYFKTFIKMHTLVIPLALWKPTYFTGNFFFVQRILTLLSVNAIDTFVFYSKILKSNILLNSIIANRFS